LLSYNASLEHDPAGQGKIKERSGHFR